MRTCLDFETPPLYLANVIYGWPGPLSKIMKLVKYKMPIICISLLTPHIIEKSDKKRIIIKNYLISVTCDESAGSQLEIKIISEPLKNLAHQKK